MATENPIQHMYDYYNEIITGSVIKYSVTADSNDTLEIRQYVDEYIDAYEMKDSYLLYSYTVDEFVTVGVTDKVLIQEYQLDKKSVPTILRDQLLTNKRNSIITAFREPNNYYRMLDGQPDYDDYDFIYVDDATAATYGIDSSIPIHLIEDTLGLQYITILEGAGYIDKLISEYPTKLYLKHLGVRRTRTITARKANNFEILNLTCDIPNVVRIKFLNLYEQCRFYYTATIFVSEYRNIIDYYDNFIALCIMIMALQQLTARSMESAINRDFFDTASTKALYEVYGLSYYSKLDEDIQLSLVQNLNMLIQAKGTNKVLFDIATLLGFTRIDIYKYYLMKEHLLDENGNPVFIKKQEWNEDTGTYEEVYDYEKMYDIYFKKVQINNYDYYEVLEDESNRVSYDTLTVPDPFWIDDAILYKEIWEREYNYKETKYLGVTTSYKLSELVYDSLLLIRMIFDKKDEITDIGLQLPSILGNTTISLFDTITLMCALTSKKYNIRGEIITQPSQVVFALDGIDALNNTVSNDVAAFDFSYLKSDDYTTMLKSIYPYMSSAEIAEFESYLSIISLETTAPADKVNAFNLMYRNIKDLSLFLTDKIVHCKTMEEYRLYRVMYDAMFYSRETAKMFNIGGDKVATTFLEYLEYANPELKEFVDNVGQDDAFSYIEHIISRLESLLTGVDNLHVMNNSTSTIQDILIDLIRFFKSYTTDMIGLNVVYIFDFKIDNLIKLRDDIIITSKSLLLKDTLKFGYSDMIAKIVAKIEDYDEFKLRDKVYIRSSIDISDNFWLHDDIEIFKDISIKDTLTLYDVLSVHGSVVVNDNMKLRDTIYRLRSLLGLSDKFTLTDIIDIVKTLSVKDRISLYDTIHEIHKELLISDNMKLRDKIIVRNLS